MASALTNPTPTSVASRSRRIPWIGENSRLPRSAMSPRPDPTCTMEDSRHSKKSSISTTRAAFLVEFLKALAAPLSSSPSPPLSRSSSAVGQAILSPDSLNANPKRTAQGAITSKKETGALLRCAGIDYGAHSAGRAQEVWQKNGIRALLRCAGIDSEAHSAGRAQEVWQKNRIRALLRCARCRKGRRALAGAGLQPSSGSGGLERTAQGARKKCGKEIGFAPCCVVRDVAKEGGL